MAAELPLLFTPMKIRGVTLPNRLVLSPLCMYSAINGMAQPWHFAHLSTFARGKVGLVMAEATAVEPRGRITPRCLGIWSDEHAAALKPITSFIESQGCVPAIQLAHAGRKASSRPPFGPKPGQPMIDDDAAEFGEGPWTAVAPSAVAAGSQWPTPKEMSQADIEEVTAAFVASAKRAIDAGFRVIELHMAHGYLMHTFLSPITNQRTDKYGGDFAGRTRFPVEVARAVRAAIPEDMPLFARVSAVDGGETEDGRSWTSDDTVELSRLMGEAGVDVVDCSSGGINGAPRFRVDDGGKALTKSSARSPGFQVPYAEAVKAGAPTVKSMAVGVIIEPKQAEAILQEGRADLIAIGRELMNDPFWLLRAAEEFGVDPKFEMWPKQYGWAVNRREQIRKMNQEEAAAAAK